MFLHQTDGSPIKIWADPDRADLVEGGDYLKAVAVREGGSPGWHDHTAVKRLLDRVNDQ